MSDDDATSAAELTDAMNRLKRQLKAIVVQIGAALAPALTALQKNIAPLITSVINWVKENRTLIVTVFKIAAAVVAGVHHQLAVQAPKVVQCMPMLIQDPRQEGALMPVLVPIQPKQTTYGPARR